MRQSRQSVWPWRALRPVLVAGLLAATVGGCAETQLAVHTAKTLSSGASASPTQQGAYKVGKPYQIQGRWYYPAEDMEYVEEGVASWYGPGFHGKQTANGEPYDMNVLTAAHRTLPMPSFVRVTNLENGRAVVLRVNDRGPFSKDRIIDVSRRGAQLLGFHDKGTTRVRVEILPEESQIAKARAITNSGEMPEVTAAPRGVVRAQSLDAPVEPEPPVAQAPAAPPPATTSSSPSLSLVTPAAAATTDAVAGGGSWVQAGAFSDMRNAENLSARLSSLAAVSIIPVTINGRDLYRVRLGPLSPPDVERILAALHADGLSSAHAVME